MTGMRWRAPKSEDVPVPIVNDEVLMALLKTRSGNSFEDRRDVAILRVFSTLAADLPMVTNLRFADVDLEGQMFRVVGKGNKIRRHLAWGTYVSLI